MNHDEKENFLWVAVKVGLLGETITVFMSLVGMVETFNKRDVIQDVITLGQFILLVTTAIMGFMAARRTSNIEGKSRPLYELTAGLVAGLMTGLCACPVHVCWFTREPARNLHHSDPCRHT